MAKKVLFVATVVKTHIMEFHIPYLRMFQQMGWETAVAARNDYEDPADCVIPFCDRYFDIPFNRPPLKPSNHTAYQMLKKIIDGGGYDIIHCHTPVGAMIARLAAARARKKGTKVIYTAHGFHFYKGAPVKNWLLYFPVEQLLSPLTDVLITINREDHVFAKKHLRPKRIEYVPGVGVDTKKFRFDPDCRLEKRREFGIAPEDFLILTVAELIPRKNHILVLKALETMKHDPDFHKIKYLVCGQGTLQSELRRQCGEMGLADNVVFADYRRDVAELCSGSDMFAFMSLQEGLPVALMEAMSCGLPCVCSRIRGNTDLIEDGVSGILAEQDPHAVAEAIRRLHHDPGLRSRLGQAAADRIRGFAAEPVQEKMQAIYLSV